MKESIQNGVRAGAIFGIIILFLSLIGFTVTASELIVEAFGGTVGEQTGSVAGMMVFVGLIGVWGGVTGARKSDPDTWGRALIGGLFSGLVSGFIMAVLAYIIGVLRAAEVDVRKYLTQLSPEVIHFLLFRMDTPTTGALANWGFLTATGLVGAILARGVGRAAWRKNTASWIRARRDRTMDQPEIKRVRTSPITRYLGYAILLGLLLLMPLYLGQYWNFTLGTVGIYVLMGLGLNIVVGMAGLLDLGYVAFFAVGAYTIGLLTAPEPHGIMLNFWIVLPLAIALASLAGVLLGIPVLRLRGDYLAIVTLGFGEIIRVLVKSDVLMDFSGGPQGVRDIAGPTLLGNPFNSERDFMYLIILGIFLVIFVTIRLQNSRVGRAWIAMREDETVAQAMGINTYQAKLLAFAIGAAFAGLGGVLFASRNQYTGPEDHNLLVSINVLSLVIVGGMGSIPGVIVGAFALKGLPEILRQIEDYRILAFGALLVVMMVLRPEGLWPSQRRSLEMHAEGEETPPEPIHPKSTQIPAGTQLNATDEMPITTDLSTGQRDVPE